MEWELMKAVTIPEGNVKRIAVNGVTIWEKQTAPYALFTPADTVRFPAKLTGYLKQELSGSSTWGASSSYLGSVYASPVFSQPVVKLGNAYSNFGNSVSSFEEYCPGDIALGYSSHVGSTSAFNIWAFDLDRKATAAEFRTWLADHPVTVLAELHVSDGSVWKAAIRNSDGVKGYLNEATDDFVPVFGIA